MPELDMNLLSLYVLNEKSLNIIFNLKDCLIRKEKTIIAHGLYQRKMPVFQTKYIEPDVTALYIEKNSIIWHEKLDHIKQKALIKLLKAITRYEFNKTPEINLNKSLKGSHNLQKTNSDFKLVLKQNKQSKINLNKSLKGSHNL
jgi:hypothetical protein